MKFRAEHVFTGITLREYEKLYFDETFNIELCQAVNLARTLVNLDDDGSKIVREVTVGPDRTLPGPVAKIVGGDRIEYMEHIEYTYGSGRASWYTEPSLLKEKIKSSGDVLASAPKG